MKFRSLGSAAVAAALLLGLVPGAALAASPEPTDTPAAIDTGSSEAGAASDDPTTVPPSTVTRSEAGAAADDPTTPPPTTPPPTPPATTPPPTTPAAVPYALTLNQPAAAWEDWPITFTGKVLNGYNGLYLTLWEKVGTTWVMRSRTRSTTGGAYKFVYISPNPSKNLFRANVGVLFPSSNGGSPDRTVTVLNRTLVMNKPAASYVVVSGVKMTGRLTPAEPGKRLVGLQDRYGGGWRTLTSAWIAPNGTFAVPVPDNLPATKTVRVITLGVGTASVEASAYAVITIKALVNARVFAVTTGLVSKTYRAGCPVRPSSLRRLLVNYWGFDHVVHRGELIVRDAAVAKMISVWTASFNAKFPIRRMQRVDVFGGSDIRAMAADNTSVFNCRQVTGNPYALSPHSYGFAIDINTVENPYLAANNVWYPSNGLAYRNRSVSRPGMLFSTSTPTKSLRSLGFFWGAGWSKPDYQHFEPK